MTPIKFGTDGWRAIIAKDFTVDNVARVAKATALWVKENYENPSVCIGHDCRFAGQLFVDTCCAVFLEAGVRVYRASNQFVSTPMVSLGTVDLNASVGVVITASHNPPDYNGYKLKGDFGGPMLPEHIAAVEALIPASVSLPEIDLAAFRASGQYVEVDLQEMYINKVRQSFDLKAIHDSGLHLAYDAMYGAGQNVIRELFPQATLLHCDYNPSFMGQAPEPIGKNLIEFSELIKTEGTVDLGLATDGDADRIGLFDSRGHFVDSHRILLLLIYYMSQVKKLDGRVITAFSTSERIGKMCRAYNLEHITTKIGFKYIAGYMVEGDVLVGGEESGGIAIAGFIPERDGIWMGLTILEFMAKTGKSLDDLLDEVYAVVGPFDYDRNDLHLTEEKKLAIIAHCENNDYQSFGDLPVLNIQTVDGYKYELPNETYVLIRASGTEPLLRVYCEAPNMQDVQETLNKVKITIL